MASAFNTSNMKAQFPNIRLACGQLIDILKSLDGKAAVDMDSALCRESLDVIGELQLGLQLMILLIAFWHVCTPATAEDCDPGHNESWGADGTRVP